VTIKKGEKAITDAQVIQIAREAILYVLLLSLPVLGVSLVVGLVISILQATTQVQEQSLTFVPKIIAVFVTLAVLAPWLLKVMVGFTGRLLARLPAVMQ
jgi:flagellar biosynthetic protein FliQ